jgi:hypothetical protein
MRVRDWQDIVSDVVERDVDPEGWRAVAGDRQSGLGEDLYLGHPQAGLFLLKTYAKNPFEVRGVGTQVARSLDDEIGDYLPTETPAKFAIHSPPADEREAETKARHLEETIKAHSEAPTTSDDLFSDVMEALESPAYGPMAYEPTDRPDQLSSLSTTFEDAEELLDAELDDLVTEDEVDRGFF